MSTVWLYNGSTPLWTFSLNQTYFSMVGAATPYWTFQVGSFEL